MFPKLISNLPGCPDVLEGTCRGEQESKGGEGIGMLAPRQVQEEFGNAQRSHEYWCGRRDAA
eukprot:365583-Chlamydomonas_euryale.AAC.2